jgi:hypothetical protein
MNMSMTGPTWLAGTFGVLMLAAAVYAAGRILVASRADRATDYEVDGHNVLMGVSMGGMLIPGLGIVTAGPSTTVWIVVWVLVTIWFALSVIRGVVRGGPGSRFSGHHLPHLVMSGAMIYTLAASTSPMGGAGMKSAMSGMGSAGGLVPWPTVDALFLVFMAGYAVLVIDRFPLLTLAGGVHGTHAGASASRPSTFLAPRMAGAENIVMAITMGYMLTMMFI